MTNPVTLEPTDHVSAFTVFTSLIDLTAQTGRPRAPADRVVIVNHTAGALSATLVDAAGVTYAIEVRAASEWVEDHRIASIAAATADTMSQIRAYWHAGSGYLNL